MVGVGKHRRMSAKALLCCATHDMGKGDNRVCGDARVGVCDCVREWDNTQHCVCAEVRVDALSVGV